jgi:hypothetical protein
MNPSEEEKAPPGNSAPTTASGRQATPPFSRSWPALVLFLLALLPYAGVLRNDFAYIYDDKAQIIDNPYVHTFGHLREALTTPVWSFAAAHSVSNYYRPVMTLGFLLCYQTVERRLPRRLCLPCIRSTSNPLPGFPPSPIWK